MAVGAVSYAGCYSSCCYKEERRKYRKPNGYIDFSFVVSPQSDQRYFIAQL